MTADLVAFLRERLDDTARKALAAADDGGLSWIDTGEAVYVRDSNSPVCVGPWTGYIADGEREHIARHDPARVLAEVDAKRRIIEVHRPDEFDSGLCRSCHRDEAGWEGSVPAEFPCLTLRLLALPDAGHPDYHEEWRP